MSRLMDASSIQRQLQCVSSDLEFDTRASELVARWRESRIGVESVEPVLRFMEEHPTLHYGMPGDLVHFVE